MLRPAVQQQHNLIAGARFGVVEARPTRLHIPVRHAVERRRLHSASLHCAPVQIDPRLPACHTPQSMSQLAKALLVNRRPPARLPDQTVRVASIRHRSVAYDNDPRQLSYQRR
jgi:hypothetical protein